MSRLDRFQQHDEDVAFACPCGAVVVAKFVLPTQDGHYAVLGGCVLCVAKGNARTSVAFLKATGNAELSRYNRFRATSPFIFKRREAA